MSIIPTEKIHDINLFGKMEEMALDFIGLEMVLRIFKRAPYFRFQGNLLIPMKPPILKH
jgi:hypothetical protein